MGTNIATYLVVSEKEWHDALFIHLKETIKGNWVRISKKETFSAETLALLRPAKVFVVHWSYLIPASIYENFECIVFHMTDLPYGRGGSPLQNLIVRGHKETKISALRVRAGIDDGPVYLKKPLQLDGSAKQIFVRASEIIGVMIKEIISEQMQPREQTGVPTLFKRRKPHESDMSKLSTIAEVYDHIRMLDADGYPHAFLETDHFFFQFTHADFTNADTITANVRITKK